MFDVSFDLHYMKQLVKNIETVLLEIFSFNVFTDLDSLFMCTEWNNGNLSLN
jgi:hypothetical protein